MKRIPIFQVDAFTSRQFAGNPAAVCLLDNWLDDTLLQSIAAENNLSETAFIVGGDGNYELRWFTPLVEVKLCGHATLATAHVLFKHLKVDQEELSFKTKSGTLSVSKSGDRCVLNFPADRVDPADPPAGLFEAMGNEPILCYKGETDYMLVYNEQKEIENLKPNFFQLSKVEARGIIATAKGEIVDFVSRFFCPQVGINEDPVTGSAHTTLTPYWSRELVKQELHAWQISQRGGDLKVKILGNRVAIAGEAKTYLEGHIFLDD